MAELVAHCLLHIPAMIVKFSPRKTNLHIRLILSDCNV